MHFNGNVFMNFGFDNFGDTMIFAEEAVLRGAVPLEFYGVIAGNAPDIKATVGHMQLTAIKRANTQLQHRVQLYAQEDTPRATNVPTITCSYITDRLSRQTSHANCPRAPKSL